MSTSIKSSVVATLEMPPIVFEETEDFIRLGFDVFIVEFYKGSYGYNKIYNRDGEVLVYDDRIIVEVQQNKNWKTIGVPVGLSWVKISDHHYEVTRSYTDSLGTDYDVTYVVKTGEPMKITLTLSSAETREYRVLWSPSGITHVKWWEEDTRLWFGGEFDGVAFDWNDVYQTWGDITKYGVETVGNGRKANIWFNIGEVQAGQTIELDPSVVGTSTSQEAVSYTPQRKGFYALGRFWVFYYDGTYTVFKTSTDGSSWSSATNLPYAQTNNFDVVYDGTYVHIAYSRSSRVKYMRGTPSSSGTISWGSEYNVASASGFVTLDVDSGGYPWIGYVASYPYVTKSLTNDGTWTTATGFPYQLHTYSDYKWKVKVVTVGNGKAVAIYTKPNYRVYIKYYNGSSWTSGVSSSYDMESGGYGYGFSALFDGTYVYIIYMVDDPRKLGYFLYYPATDSVTSVYTLSTSFYGFSLQLSRDSSTGDLYAFYYVYDDGKIYYRKKSGSWASAVEIATTDAASTYYGVISAFEKSDSHIGLIYLSGTSSPYNINFTEISLVSPPTVSTSNATDITFGQATLNGSITDTGGENCDQRGFDWGYSTGSYGSSWTESGSFGTGSFNHQVTGLTEGATVYFRAKAHNSAGWGYGTEESFVVPAGWSGIVSGIQNPAEIMGISRTQIKKVSGIQ